MNIPRGFKIVFDRFLQSLGRIDQTPDTNDFIIFRLFQVGESTLKYYQDAVEQGNQGPRGPRDPGTQGTHKPRDPVEQGTQGPRNLFVIVFCLRNCETEVSSSSLGLCVSSVPGSPGSLGLWAPWVPWVPWFLIPLRKSQKDKNLPEEEDLLLQGLGWSKCFCCHGMRCEGKLSDFNRPNKNKIIKTKDTTGTEPESEAQEGGEDESSIRGRPPKDIAKFLETKLNQVAIISKDSSLFARTLNFNEWRALGRAVNALAGQILKTPEDSEKLQPLRTQKLKLNAIMDIVACFRKKGVGAKWKGPFLNEWRRIDANLKVDLQEDCEFRNKKNGGFAGNDIILSDWLQEWLLETRAEFGLRGVFFLQRSFQN